MVIGSSSVLVHLRGTGWQEGRSRCGNSRANLTSNVHQVTCRQCLRFVGERTYWRDKDWRRSDEKKDADGT